jgi:hypothetical protein
VQQSITTNTLFYGDNLAIMCEYIPDESVDLVYLVHLQERCWVMSCSALTSWPS